MPPWELRFFGFEVPNPFYPAALMPGLTFAALYAWPFLEARFTGDRAPHHLLDRPRDHPLRTAFGTTTLAFYTVMFFASSADLLAKWFLIPVLPLVVVFQVLLVVLPPVVGILTFWLMKALAASGAEWIEVRVEVRRRSRFRT